MENREVDNLKCCVVCLDTDYGEDCSGNIACKDTDNERNELCHLLAVNRADNNSKESYESADKRNIRACG